MSLFHRVLLKLYAILVNLSYSMLQFLIGLLFRYVPRKTIHKLFVDNRAWLITFIVVPASFVYDLFARIRSWVVWCFFQTKVLHDIKVQNIQNQVLEWRKNGCTKKMCTNRSVYASMSLRLSSFKKDCSKIDIGLLNDIIEVDLKRQIVRLEPCVNMGQITDHLNKLGWTLAVTIEMEDLTVGGLLMGMGVENNSHIYGMLHETCVAYEVVTGDGKLLRCTENENEDLFRTLPGSHGTLGFLVACELKIIPCKKWLKVNYIPCKTQDELQDKLVQSTTDRETAPQFVEATIYSRQASVVFTADFCDEPSGSERRKINRLNLWFKPWFYKHVETYLQKGADYEYVPIRDWFHRHTRSIFWELEDLIPFGNSPLYRYTWGILGAPKVSLLKSIWTSEIRQDLVYKHVVQDIIMPLRHLKQSIDISDELFGCYPLLFYPIRIFPREPEAMIKNPKVLINNDPKEGEIYFDLGIYGVPKCVLEGKSYDGPKQVHKLHKFAKDNDGFYFLYTDIFFNEQEFEETFNFDLYNRCREKYAAKNAFPTIWQKVKPDFSTLID